MNEKYSFLDLSIEFGGGRNVSFAECRIIEQK